MVGSIERMLLEVGRVWKEVEGKGIIYWLVRVKHLKANKLLFLANPLVIIHFIK